MVAYDSRHGSDGKKRLSDDTASALVAALRAQRDGGRSPMPALDAAIASAASEARDIAMEPEQLIVQLKRLAEDAGLSPAMGDEQTNAIREWMVSACIQAYFKGR